MWRYRKACVALTALAVFLVSATCTSAGCLIVPDAPPVAGQASSSCCAHHPEKPAVPSDGRRCPLCEGSNLIAKMVVKNSATTMATTQIA